MATFNRIEPASFKSVFGVAAIATAGVLAVRPTPVAAQAIGEVDLLCFLANLEYLQTQYFRLGTGSAPLSQFYRPVESRPDVIGGRTVTFTILSKDTALDVVRSVRGEDFAHLTLLMREIRRIAPTVSFVQPPIDVSGTPLGPFSRAGRMAGLIADSGADSA